jgi:hypothetical protein
MSRLCIEKKSGLYSPPQTLLIVFVFYTNYSINIFLNLNNPLYLIKVVILSTGFKFTLI